jgi:hypothetical protein
MTKQLARMKKLPLLTTAKEFSKSTIHAKATIHAVQDVTVVLIVAVDGAHLARSIAIQWHHSRKVRVHDRSSVARDRSIENVLLTC